VASTQAGQAPEAAPDGALVELVTITGGTQKSIASTTVKAGRFQFDGQAVALGANTLVQLNVAGVLYRAPAFANDVEVSPYSEAVLLTVSSGKVSMISTQEYEALLQAGRWIDEFARGEPGATAAVQKPANLQRLLAADTAYAAYLQSAEQDAASTTAVAGDVGNLMPLTAGMRRQYRDDSGKVVPLINDPATGAGEVAVRSEQDGSVQQWKKKSDGLYGTSFVELMGTRGTIRISLGDLPLVPFSPKVGLNRSSATPAVQSTADVDGDGKLESSSVTWSLQVEAVEMLPVLGVTTATLRISRKVTGKLTLSSDQSVGTLQTEETYWLAPKVGLVRIKGTTSIEHPLLRSNQTSERTLHAWAPDAASPLRFNGGVMRHVPLTYSKLVMDLPRRRLLALLNGAELTKGRSLASINVDTGEVTYSPLSVGALDELAVAPTGEIYAAVSTGNPDEIVNNGCSSTATVLRLGATSLAEEARYALAKGASAYCPPGKVTFMHALSASTVIVQGRQGMGSEVIRLDNGVRATGDINGSGNGSSVGNPTYWPLVQPIQKAFIVGSDIYLVSSSTSYRAPFGAGGFGKTEPLWGLGFNSAVMPWLVGTTIRGSYQQFDIVSGLASDAGLGKNYCGLQGVPGRPEWAACGTQSTYYVGDFETYEWATGRLVSKASLPWAAEAWSLLLQRGVVFDEWTVIYQALASGNWDATSQHTGLYIATRDKN